MLSTSRSSWSRTDYTGVELRVQALLAAVDDAFMHGSLAAVAGVGAFVGAFVVLVVALVRREEERGHADATLRTSRANVKRARAERARKRAERARADREQAARLREQRARDAAEKRADRVAAPPQPRPAKPEADDASLVLFLRDDAGPR
jgi:hypothetical protein